ncbi:collagen alpha-1(I) chain-like [Rhineura floridana]|uniref:collagen alpha-1(I) chain-like n=1 Tax=Rhineura floridana TaxID=261503 RepID=UPI002AC841B9|nr:collagen alpha-1(I) chain-like [Rhineura floridana]
MPGVGRGRLLVPRPRGCGFGQLAAAAPPAPIDRRRLNRGSSSPNSDGSGGSSTSELLPAVQLCKSAREDSRRKCRFSPGPTLSGAAFHPPELTHRRAEARHDDPPLPPSARSALRWLLALGPGRRPGGGEMGVRSLAAVPRRLAKRLLGPSFRAEGCAEPASQPTDRPAALEGARLAPNAASPPAGKGKPPEEGRGVRAGGEVPAFLSPPGKLGENFPAGGTGHAGKSSRKAPVALGAARGVLFAQEEEGAPQPPREMPSPFCAPQASSLSFVPSSAPPPKKVR